MIDPRLLKAQALVRQIMQQLRAEGVPQVEAAQRALSAGADELKKSEPAVTKQGLRNLDRTKKRKAA